MGSVRQNGVLPSRRSFRPLGVSGESGTQPDARFVTALSRRESDAVLPLHLFSLYAVHVASDEQVAGEDVTDEQIQKWADEAEAGYDVEDLKRRGRGRPGRGAEPMQVIAVRLTAEEIAALDAYAAREHLSRSEAIRRALAGYAA